MVGVRMSDQPQSLAAALAELQQHLPRISKDSAAVVETKTGRTYGYKYADLATISAALLPIMGKLGLSFTACPTMDDGQFVLKYALRWSGEHGSQYIGGSYPLPSSTPQTMGGAITYARRYCLLAVTGAAPDEDDDDAQAAEQAAHMRVEDYADPALMRHARAQRNAPPEVREDGSATEAELERMRSGPEPGAWRSTSTAENDPHYDQPRVADMEDWPPENQPASSLPEQRQSIYVALGRRGIKDHKGAIERLIRWEIADPRDMSYNEATSVLARVRSWDGRTEELLAPLMTQRSSA